MSQIWEWLSGKKMLIGLFILALIGQSAFLHLLPEGDLGNLIVWILQYIGMTLTGTGALHKVVKWKENKDTLKDYK